MVKLVILFRTGAHTEEYHEQYNRFLMELEAIPGLRRKAVSTVYGSQSGKLPFSAMVEATFDTREAMQSALSSDPGTEAGRTLLQFAGPDAIVLFTDTLEETFEPAGDAGNAPA